ncbi:DinB family protein [Paenibacillus caseinilyticus]|uniref:Glyoxalase n=1 Tax=Paenibacillus mucilaginosus K02 TaxID=997761 RepID=I0BNM2_9BACL|nr:DinB family protein [Paenibacillus mucilaginosus]AFH63969.1 glyoxalase [Paenibacillus mucilaginosus K02]
MQLNEDDRELIGIYQRAGGELAQAIEGLSGRELDRTREPGKWSIREIVHHIVDCDMNYFQINRYALADTGETYFFPVFDAGVWNRTMQHAMRSVEREVKLFGAMRDYIAYLCTVLPGAMDRTLVHEHGRAQVRDAIRHDIAHAAHHIRQIRETRSVHRL